MAHIMKARITEIDASHLVMLSQPDRATGLSIWKPVQLGWLTDKFGGYPFARGIQLAAMTGIALFVVVHLTLVVISPRTLVAMLAGKAAEPEESAR